MPWRVLEIDGRRWNVSMAAERRANTAAWCLVLSFRSDDPERRVFWTQYPLESTSRSMLFAQVDRIPEARLRSVLVDHLG